ncbi:zinc-binding dehydrogenase [Sphingopyxis granuli]|jgi:threonine dehydrogenase-like Zn-dependent dehydrogenase|uniref:zinc-binding dehydrogenase n=1 Tax=Sphingopyxis granuli TaxID=267128 RepID=UPI00301C1197
MGEDMRAAIYRRGELVVGTFADPIPEAGQVLVKTMACGICGSDLHFCDHAQEFTSLASRAGVAAMEVDLSRDIVLGHEFCGEVMDHGPSSDSRLKPGQLVCSLPVVLGSPGARTIGYSDEYPGGFGEYMVLTEALLLPVPNGLPAALAALTEPMAVGWHAVEIARVRPHHVPLVIGCGPVGLAVIAALKQKQIAPIIASDLSPDRRDLALRMGADAVVDPREDSPFLRAQKIARPVGIGGALSNSVLSKNQLVFECVGLPGMLRHVMDNVSEEAEIVVVGACMQPDSIEPMMGMFKALTVKFSRTYTGEEFAEVLQMIAQGALDVSPLVTDVIGLSDVPATFDALRTPGAQAKVIVDPWR